MKLFSYFSERLTYGHVFCSPPSLLLLPRFSAPCPCLTVCWQLSGCLCALSMSYGALRRKFQLTAKQIAISNLCATCNSATCHHVGVAVAVVSFFSGSSQELKLAAVAERRWSSLHPLARLQVAPLPLATCLCYHSPALPLPLTYCCPLSSRHARRWADGQINWLIYAMSPADSRCWSSAAREAQSLLLVSLFFRGCF